MTTSAVAETAGGATGVAGVTTAVAETARMTTSVAGMTGMTGITTDRGEVKTGVARLTTAVAEMNMPNRFMLLQMAL